MNKVTLSTLTLLSAVGLSLLSLNALAGSLCYGGDPLDPASCVAGYYQCDNNSDCVIHDCSVCMDADHLRGAHTSCGPTSCVGPTDDSGAGCSISCAAGEFASCPTNSSCSCLSCPP